MRPDPWHPCHGPRQRRHQREEERRQHQLAAEEAKFALRASFQASGGGEAAEIAGDAALLVTKWWHRAPATVGDAFNFACSVLADVRALPERP